MNFYWNYDSPTNLLLDLGFLALCVLATAGWLRLRGLPLAPSSEFLQASGWRGALRWLGEVALALLAVTAAVALAMLQLDGLRAMFGLVRLGWTAMSVLAPAVLVVLAWRLRRAPRLALPVLFAAIALFGLKAYAEVYEPQNLEVSRHRVPASEERRAGATVRIAHLSDLQTDGVGAMHARVLREVDAFQPHAIAFTGDVRNDPRLDPTVFAWLRKVAALAPPGQAFFVPGDIDRGMDWTEFARATGFRVLEGRGAVVRVGVPTKANIAGLNLRQMGSDALIARLARESAADRTVLLCHRPDCMFATIRANRRLREEGAPGVDLLLAGHTHGGQIQLPFFGPPITLTRAPRSVAAGGLSRVEGLWIGVSRGLGMEGGVAPRIRFRCRPELALVELE